VASIVFLMSDIDLEHMIKTEVWPETSHREAAVSFRFLYCMTLVQQIFQLFTSFCNHLLLRLGRDDGSFLHGIIRVLHKSS